MFLVKIVIGLSTLQTMTEEHPKVFMVTLPAMQINKTKSHISKGRFSKWSNLRLCVPTRTTIIAITRKTQANTSQKTLTEVTSVKYINLIKIAIVKNGVFNKIPIKNAIILVVLIRHTVGRSRPSGWHLSEHSPSSSFLSQKLLTYDVVWMECHNRIKNFDDNIRNIILAVRRKGRK